MFCGAHFTFPEESERADIVRAIHPQKKVREYLCVECMLRESGSRKGMHGNMRKKMGENNS